MTRTLMESLIYAKTLVSTAEDVMRGTRKASVMEKLAECKALIQAEIDLLQPKTVKKNG